MQGGIILRKTQRQIKRFPGGPAWQIKNLLYMLLRRWHQNKNNRRKKMTKKEFNLSGKMKGGIKWKKKKSKHGL